MALPSDAYRKEQLLCSIANADSPVNTFTWGNLITLRDNINDDDLYGRVHEFRKRHYSAHRMTLAIQARLPMDTLETYVKDCFSAVPTNDLPAIDFKTYRNNVFNSSIFNRIYYLKPMRDICQIELTWALPSLLDMYKSKPHQYVSWILGHEGKGSLLSALRDRVWALSIVTGNGETGLEHNSMYSLFTITLVLTPEGLEHLSEVIKMVFGYIKLLKDVGPQERIFKEIQLIDATSFRFAEEESAVETVEDLAEAMQVYPSEDYIAGSELYFEYNPKAIEMVVDHLTPDNMNIMVLSTKLPLVVNGYDKTEKWFGTAYTDKEISKEWKDLWYNAKPLECFHLPEPNIFVTSNFSLKTPPNETSEYPVKILDNEQVELWHRQDTKFKLPIAYYYFYLITPFSLESPRSACMLDMYVGLLSLLINEEAYPAHVAELSYTITVGDKGIIIKVDGYNEKLPVLISLISKYIINFKTLLRDDMFDAYKDKLVKHYYNNFLKPTKLSKDVRMGLLLNTYWSSLDKHAVVKEISYDNLLDYCDKVIKELFVLALIQGNVNQDTAMQTTLDLIKDINCTSLPRDCIPKIKVAKIPAGGRCCRVMSFNPNDSNSIVVNYYQSGPSDFKVSVIIELLMMILEEPLFDILRTKEQLGYHVYCTIRETFGILGYSITVNAQAVKNSTQHVNERIENFVKYAMNLLKKLPEKRFNEFKRDLIKIKQCADVHLKDEVSRNWSEIAMQEYVFDRLKQEINAIENIKLVDLRKWWEAHNSFGNKNNFKKLSVQIVGYDTSDKKVKCEKCKTDKECSEHDDKRRAINFSKTEKEDAVDSANSKYTLKFISNSVESAKTKTEKDEFITSINEFKDLDYF